MSRPVLRFAPSPNGELHLGHAFSALLAQDWARRLEGRLLLRIEDIDIGRCRPEYEAAIYEDLAWLGIAWEPPVRRQSEHFADYRAALDQLDAMGLVYPCFASRGEIAAAVKARALGGGAWPRDPEGAPLYPGLGRDVDAAEAARRQAAGEPFTLRLDMTKAIVAAGALTWREVDAAGAETIVAAEPDRWGDVVVARKDVPTSYHLAVIVDDSLQGVSHVVRGRDLYESTAVHRLLQALLGLGEPVYHHHRLILGQDGRKLAKSHRDSGLGALREAGATPAMVRRMVGLP